MFSDGSESIYIPALDSHWVRFMSFSFHTFCGMLVINLFAIFLQSRPFSMIGRTFGLYGRGKGEHEVFPSEYELGVKFQRTWLLLFKKVVSELMLLSFELRVVAFGSLFWAPLEAMLLAMVIDEFDLLEE